MAAERKKIPKPEEGVPFSGKKPYTFPGESIGYLGKSEAKKLRILIVEMISQIDDVRKLRELHAQLDELIKSRQHEHRTIYPPPPKPPKPRKRK